MPAPKGHAPYPGCEKGGTPLVFTQESIEKYADLFSEWLQDPEHIWFKDFAIEKRINPDLLSKWAKENEKFNGIYKLAKEIQESRVINGGLRNKLNAGLVKFMLVAKHGWESETSIIDAEILTTQKLLMDQLLVLQQAKTDQASS